MANHRIGESVSALIASLTSTMTATNTSINLRFDSIDKKLEQICKENREDHEKFFNMGNDNARENALTKQALNTHVKEHHGLVDWMQMGFALLGGMAGGFGSRLLKP